MSNTFSPKGWMPWVKNTGKAVGTGFGLKVASDSYNRMADNKYKRVEKKGENRKKLRVTTKELEKKSAGIENPETADAINAQIQEEYKEATTEYAQSNLEEGETCMTVLQGIKSAKGFPQKTETASILHVVYKGNFPGFPTKENGILLEYKDKNGKILEGETSSTLFDPSDRSKATSQATIQVNDNKGKATIQVKKDKGKGAPSSFASLSNTIPWDNPEISVTVTTLNVKTGVIEQRVLSKEETKCFQGVVPERHCVPVKNPPTNLHVVGIVLVLVAFSSLIVSKIIKKNIFFSEK